MTSCKMELTIEQKAIVECVRSGTGHVLVEALAGTGKTSTIVACLPDLAARRVLLCAFAKQNARDLKARIPASSSAQAQTAHSLGFDILKDHGCRSQVVSDDDKIDGRRIDVPERLVNAAADAAEAFILKESKSPAGAPIWAPPFDASGRAISFDVRRASRDILEHLRKTHFERDVAADEVEKIGWSTGAFTGIGDNEVTITCMIVRRAYLRGAQLDRDFIDYDDMVWLPLVLDLLPSMHYDIVFVDEAQDFSLPQFTLVKKVLALRGRLVIVGDLHQSIYGWRGAVGDQIWAEMREVGATVMPLTASFRCSVAVVEVANQIVPQLRARHGAPQGRVRMCSYTEMLKEISRATVSTYVLSRNNSTLLRMALQLWKLREPPRFVYSKGEDMAKGLRRIIARLDKRDVARFRSSLETWHEFEHARAKKAGAIAWADVLNEQYDMLLALLECAAPDALEQLLANIVEESRGAIVRLSTVHGVKGLEADCAYLLRQTFVRHREKPPDPIPKEELNLEYVAITRVKTELVWVDLTDMEPDK